MNIHKSQLFWCELQGYKVLTHCHLTNKAMVFFCKKHGINRGINHGIYLQLNQFCGWNMVINHGILHQNQVGGVQLELSHPPTLLVISIYQENLQYTIQHSSNPTIYICG